MSRCDRVCPRPSCSDRASPGWPCCWWSPARWCSPTVSRARVYGGIDYVFTLENYERVADPLYLKIFWQSFRIAIITTVLALLIGYPAAYYISLCSPRRQKVLLVLAILPFWSNYLIRTYAWIVLLNREGLINRALGALGIADEPLPLLYNQFSIVVGLLYAYLPFMILALYSSIAQLGPGFARGIGRPRRRLPGDTRERDPAAHRAGYRSRLRIRVRAEHRQLHHSRSARRWRSIMVGNLIYDQFLTARDWPFGSALAFGLIGIMLMLLLAQAWLVNRGTEVRGS